MLADNSRNPSAHEAAAAMEMANKMMQQYNISLSEIQLEEMKAEKGVEGEGIRKSKFKKWERTLSAVVSDFFCCGSYTKFYWDKEKRSYFQRVVFYGAKDDVYMCEQTFSVLRKTIVRMSSENGYESSQKKSYCWGVVRALHDKVEQGNKNSDPKCKDVMVIKNQVATKYEEENLDLKAPRKSKVNIDDFAYFHGMKDGRNVSLTPDRNTLE